jgi:hypothetical protein
VRESKNSEGLDRENAHFSGHHDIETTIATESVPPLPEKSASFGNTKYDLQASMPIGRF